MKKIVIIGANDFQRPLIQKAKEMGYETHVFAWLEGATGAMDADHFYEISITEKERILGVCRKIRPDAVATIGSDLANVTVQYLTERLGLPGNSRTCVLCSTNKFEMRRAFERAGLEVPYYQVVRKGELPSPPAYPVIVKPTDRSGSRAITRVESIDGLAEAIENAVGQSFEGRAIVEEYIAGREYSVETISFGGRHVCLAITKKYTTGEPNYIEVGHLEPAPLTDTVAAGVQSLVFAGLDALGIRFGAAHSEVRIDSSGKARIIEIGSRMGGDCIGSDLVPLSTGQDYVRMVVDAAAGRPPQMAPEDKKVAAIRFLMCERDLEHLKFLQKTCPGALKKSVIEGSVKDAKIVDSSSRPGFYILQAQTMEEMERLLHRGPEINPAAREGSAAWDCMERMREGHFDALLLEEVPGGTLGEELEAACADLGFPFLRSGACPDRERWLLAEEELEERGFRPLYVKEEFC